ncbi:MAG: DUF3842 family protein [Syntrophomonadaceae bacterium]|nr:DUF3842 family protein [Syntrophomonadaceae bacterium]
MRIAVIDGQGGGIGKHITERLRQEFPTKVEIIALGTNALATSLMLKSGANEGASGENAVVQSVADVDIIIGSISILIAHSMLGEITPAMTEAIGKSKAVKFLLPINRSKVEVMGVVTEPLPHLVNLMISKIKALMEVNEHVRSKSIYPAR